MKQTNRSIKSHRYELVHGEDDRLYRLSTEVWRWPLADGFNVDDPAYAVSVADRARAPELMLSAEDSGCSPKMVEQTIAIDIVKRGWLD